VGAGSLEVDTRSITAIYRLIQEIHVMAERSPAALRAVCNKYDSELLDQQIRKQC
jgi:hypothetical protein